MSEFEGSPSETELALADFRERVYDYLERELIPVVSGVEYILEVSGVMDKFLSTLEVVVDQLVAESFAARLERRLTLEE